MLDWEGRSFGLGRTPRLARVHLLSGPLLLLLRDIPMWYGRAVEGQSYNLLNVLGRLRG